MTKINRKLTTILATDCVGFSRLMEENEELTLQNSTNSELIWIIMNFDEKLIN